MVDVRKSVKQEKREIALDAIMVGVLAAMTLVLRSLEAEWWIVLACAILCGMRLGVLSVRFRIMDWMDIVHRQEAVIEQLLNQVEDQIPTPKPTAPRPPKNGMFT